MGNDSTKGFIDVLGAATNTVAQLAPIAMMGIGIDKSKHGGDVFGGQGGDVFGGLGGAIYSGMGGGIMTGGMAGPWIDKSYRDTPINPMMTGGKLVSIKGKRKSSVVGVAKTRIEALSTALTKKPVSKAVLVEKNLKLSGKNLSIRTKPAQEKPEEKKSLKERLSKDEDMEELEEMARNLVKKKRSMKK